MFGGLTQQLVLRTSRQQSRDWNAFSTSQFCLIKVAINPESRGKVEPGAARVELVEKATRIFLVKVLNAAGVTSQLQVQSENSGPFMFRLPEPGAALPDYA